MTQSSIGHDLGEVAGAWSAAIMRHTACDMLRLLQREDLSLPRLVTLMFIGRHNQASISDIAEHLNLALGTTSHLVDQLVAANFVVRYENPDDRRLKYVQLTERGHTLVGEVQRIRVTELTRRLQYLPESLQQRLVDVMREAIEVLNTQDAVSDVSLR